MNEIINVVELNPVTSINLSRENWLNIAVSKFREGLFKEQGEDIPTVTVSVGFPGGGSARKRIGEFWHAKATTNNVPQIFISPVKENVIEVLDILAHELVHACKPDAKHGKEFGKLARALGLEGKLTATKAGEKLKARLATLANEIGPYPVGAINLNSRKKQSTNLLKVYCDSCGYPTRVTRKWLDKVGAPICPCSNKQMIIEVEQVEEAS